MELWYPYSTKQEKNIVVILHIYGARENLPLFYYDKDTSST